MSLRLIVGPPNSGRSGEVLLRLRDTLADDPVLIVPTLDDAAQLERDLCGGDEPALGATVTTFAWFFADLARELTIDGGPTLGGAERIALVRAAVGSTSLPTLGRSAARPGFAPAMLDLVDELEAGLVDPATLAERAGSLPDGAVERDLAAVYAAYVELRRLAGRTDAGEIAARLLRAIASDAEPLRGRPLFVYGFDDLTRAQLELVEIAAAATALSA